jgi:hypothetical protein
MTPSSLSVRHLRSATAERPFRKSGTDGSNPVPSSGESCKPSVPPKSTDPANGVSGVILMQMIPFADVKALAVFAGFETAVYAALS